MGVEPYYFPILQTGTPTVEHTNHIIFYFTPAAAKSFFAFSISFCFLASSFAALAAVSFSFATFLGLAPTPSPYFVLSRGGRSRTDNLNVPNVPCS